MRVALAQALFVEPMMLLLDEVWHAQQHHGIIITIHMTRHKSRNKVSTINFKLVSGDN